jgi:hypothetical protein
MILDKLLLTLGRIDEIQSITKTNYSYLKL